MINNISEKIASAWTDKGIIEKEDYELYHYGWFIVLSEALFFVFTVIISAIFNIILPGIVFFFSYFFIRRFAGGLHAKTEAQCLTLSLSFLFLSILALKYMSGYINDVCAIAAYLLCTALLIVFSPADTPQKPLLKDERKMFKKIIAGLSAAFFVILCVLLHFDAKIYAVSILCAFVLETVLVLLGRMFNKRLEELNQEN